MALGDDRSTHMDCAWSVVRWPLHTRHRWPLGPEPEEAGAVSPGWAADGLMACWWSLREVGGVHHAGAGGLQARRQNGFLQV